MTTDVIGKEDTDWLTLIDYESDVACESIDIKDCPNPAEWLMIRSCCGLQHLYCTPCKERIIKWLNGNFLSTCIRCGAGHTKPPFFTIVEKL